MGLFSLRKTCKFALNFSLLFIFLASVHVSCYQHDVGGKRGWIKPDGSESETYNEWAQQNRFHIGDTLYFKYTNDTVLLVKLEDYSDCNINNPISKFEDGNTVFEFDHSGFYYFISGEPGHCLAGQKMIVWVMAPHHHTISPAPTPGPYSSHSEGPIGSWDGGDVDSWGPSQTNSTDSVSVTSILLNLFMGVVIVLYVFME